MVTLYGIPNCDTVRKARKWLDSHNVRYRFHDFRRDGLTDALVGAWLQTVPAEKLVNKRSTAWRDLPEPDRIRVGEQPARYLAKYPTLVKRPVLVAGSKRVEVGFTPARYGQLLDNA